MLRSGDVLIADLGEPTGREAGFPRPVIIVTAQRILDAHPNVVHVVPLTSTVREHRTEVALDPDSDNGLSVRSAAQCQHVRAIAVRRLSVASGNVGPRALAQLREVLADLLDL
jgi:mRNA interferase MazF